MAEQLPESGYERMTADERAKERLERQKLLVSLPKASLEQKYMAFVATLTVEVQENLKYLLLLANALPGAPAAVVDGKNRLIQAGRGALERAGRTHKIALVGAKEGPDTAQRIFNPEPLLLLSARQNDWQGCLSYHRKGRHYMFVNCTCVAERGILARLTAKSKIPRMCC